MHSNGYFKRAFSICKLKLKSKHLLVKERSKKNEDLSRTLTYQKKCVICLIESPINMMKNAFYFILKALFVLKVFRFLSRLFGQVGKTA